MQGKRTERVGHLIQMELGQLILHRVKDPRLGFITITHVNVTPDLRSAAVFYSSLGDEKARKESQLALDKATGFLQKEIGVALELRYTPKLKFMYDDSIDRGLEIDKVLRDIQSKERSKTDQ
jgi:ribosome-binding factor A